MPEVPDAAVEAAVEAVLKQPGLAAEDLRPWVKWISTTVLEAAAPVMAEAVAQRILAHMDAHGPQAGTPLGGQVRRAWRRHFGIAAQVAALAFSTPEDVKRMAAEAIGRGDYLACTGLDDQREDEDR